MAEDKAGWKKALIGMGSAMNPAFKQSYDIVSDIKSRAAGKQAVQDTATKTDYDPTDEMKKGGRVKKTAVYRLHKGELVIPAKIVKRLEKRKISRKSGRR
jgi:hypothetical protein